MSSKELCSSVFFVTLLIDLWLVTSVFIRRASTRQPRRIFDASFTGAARPHQARRVPESTRTSTGNLAISSHFLLSVRTTQTLIPCRHNAKV
jgi:hypothetical protein